MAYLNTDNARWGQLRHLLPPPYDQEFRRIINTLHIQYGYDGNSKTIRTALLRNGDRRLNSLSRSWNSFQPRIQLHKSLS
jgi:hypothetical protein